MQLDATSFEFGNVSAPEQALVGKTNRYLDYIRDEPIEEAIEFSSAIDGDANLFDQTICTQRLHGVEKPPRTGQK